MSGVSSTAAHWALQYLLSDGTRQVQGGCAHFFVSSVVIVNPPTFLRNANYCDHRAMTGVPADPSGHGRIPSAKMADSVSASIQGGFHSRSPRTKQNRLNSMATSRHVMTLRHGRVDRLTSLVRGMSRCQRAISRSPLRVEHSLTQFVFTDLWGKAILLCRYANTKRNLGCHSPDFCQRWK